MNLTGEPRLFEDEDGIGPAGTEQRIRAVIKDFSGDARTILEDILDAIINGTTGVAFNLRGAATTVVAGATVNVLTSTVPAATTRTIKKIIVTTRAAGSFEIKVGGSVVGSGRTSSAGLNIPFEFSVGLAVLTGVTIDVEFTMLYGKIGQDVEAYLMSSDV
jgi:hypothetical protein